MSTILGIGRETAESIIKFSRWNLGSGERVNKWLNGKVILELSFDEYNIEIVG